jgi:hypothetical protein
MYDFAVQFSPEQVQLSFLFYVKVSLDWLVLISFIKAQNRRKIIFKSDLYGLNLFHFKVRVLIS